MARISVVGGGYVGLVTSACFAEMGHSVTCIEIDPTRLSALRRGVTPIFEPKLDALVERNVQGGRLYFTDDYAATIPDSQFTFITVSTPPHQDGSANTEFVFSSLRSIMDYAADELTIVVKSTVPVGTGDELSAVLATAGRRCIAIVSNPEFLRQGSAVDDFFQPARVVVGADDPCAGDKVAALFSSLDSPVVRCSRRSAELAKYASNALLAIRISFMNEMAAVCEALDGNIEEIADIVGKDPRIGPHYLRAGLGWGGSCFSKDVRALSALAQRNGVSTPITDAAYVVNQRQRDLAYGKLHQSLIGRADAVVGVLGLAFKPETDDLREAPAIDIVRRLLADGVKVRAHDPAAMNNARKVLPDVTYCDNPYDVADGVDVLFLATEWCEYGQLDWDRMSDLMRGNKVLDGRHILDRKDIQSAGLTYLSFGRQAADKDDTVRLPAWPARDILVEALGSLETHLNTTEGSSVS